MRTLVCVAHPDDEVLWSGSYLLEHPGTHVACCCIDTRKPERTARFYEACEFVNAVPFVLAGKFDIWGLELDPILAFAERYDRIITHNAIGEYGHPAHIKLHYAMRALKKPMQVFSYGILRGEPVRRYEDKLAAIAIYKDPALLPWLQKRFNLAYEGLVDAYNPPFRKRRAARSARRLRPRSSARRASAY